MDASFALIWGRQRSCWSMALSLGIGYAQTSSDHAPHTSPPLKSSPKSQLLCSPCWPWILEKQTQFQICIFPILYQKGPVQSPSCLGWRHVGVECKVWIPLYSSFSIKSIHWMIKSDACYPMQCSTKLIDLLNLNKMTNQFFSYLCVLCFINLVLLRFVPLGFV